MCSSQILCMDMWKGGSVAEMESVHDSMCPLWDMLQGPLVDVCDRSRNHLQMLDLIVSLL